MPLRSKRSIVSEKLTGKSDRWNRICIEACKQSRRLYIPRVWEPITLQEAFDKLPNPHVAGLDWEGSNSHGAAWSSNVTSVLIGPEGGWDPAELALFQQNRIPQVSLSSNILRTETAAMVAAALMTGFRDQLLYKHP